MLAATPLLLAFSGMSIWGKFFFALHLVRLQCSGSCLAACELTFSHRFTLGHCAFATTNASDVDEQCAPCATFRRSRASLDDVAQPSGRQRQYVRTSAEARRASITASAAHSITYPPLAAHLFIYHVRKAAHGGLSSSVSRAALPRLPAPPYPSLSPRALRDLSRIGPGCTRQILGLADVGLPLPRLRNADAQSRTSDIRLGYSLAGHVRRAYCKRYATR